MSSDESANASLREREVVEETINAYRVQKLDDGNVRIKSGGHVVTASTYFEALSQYAERERFEVETGPEHLRDDKRESIYDGSIPLKSLDSAGFTPEEILDAVTIQPLGVVLEDIDDR